MRTYLSAHLLWSALHFARLAREIEHGPGRRPRFDIRQRAHVLGGVISSVAFLEAVANELFQDAEHGHGMSGQGYLALLPVESVHGLADAWSRGADRLDVVAKYRRLLTSAGLPDPNIGRAPFQDVTLLTDLRNAVVHYRPESLVVDQGSQLEAKLRQKFPSNALLTTNPWWPDGAMGAGCAGWAIRSAVALTDHVSLSLGIRPNYRRLLDEGWAAFGEP